MMMMMMTMVMILMSSTTDKQILLTMIVCKNPGKIHYKHRGKVYKSVDLQTTDNHDKANYEDHSESS